MKLCLSCNAPAVESDDTVPLCAACRALRSNPRGIVFQKGPSVEAKLKKAFLDLEAYPERTQWALRPMLLALMQNPHIVEKLPDPMTCLEDVWSGLQETASDEQIEVDTANWKKRFVEKVGTTPQIEELLDLFLAEARFYQFLANGGDISPEPFLPFGYEPPPVAKPFSISTPIRERLEWDSVARRTFAVDVLPQRGDAFAAMVARVGEPADSILATMTIPGQPLKPNPLRYTYTTFWSHEDQEYAGTCREFPSLSHLDPDLKKAFEGIIALVSEVSDELIVERDELDRIIEQTNTEDEPVGGPVFGLVSVREPGYVPEYVNVRKWVNDTHFLGHIPQRYYGDVLNDEKVLGVVPGLERRVYEPSETPSED